MRLAPTTFTLILAVAGCGGDKSSAGPDRPDTAATLVLDFRPNAVHAGIYEALARDYDARVVRQANAGKPAALNRGARAGPCPR